MGDHILHFVIDYLYIYLIVQIHIQKVMNLLDQFVVDRKNVFRDNKIGDNMMVVTK